MLALRPNCEHCGTDLPYNATGAMICTFECTFCQHCVETVLYNVCPNCGGGFSLRPVRPKQHLARHPPAMERLLKPVDSLVHRALREQYGCILPENR